MRARLSQHFALAALAALAGCESCEGCSCSKEETEQVALPPPPSPGGASEDLVDTNIGRGLGLGSIAPTSTKWSRVFVIDDKTAVVVGTSIDEAIALRTTDKGRTWDALKSKLTKSVTWGTGVDGSLALLGGDTEKVKVPKGQRKPVISAKFWFAPKGRTMSEPSVLFPTDDLKNARIPTGFSMPAVLDGELASVVVDQNRSSTILFGTPGGQKQPDPIEGARTKIVTAPFGRPPQLLTESRGSIAVQAWPKPGGKVENGTPIAGFRAPPGTFDKLSKGPDCEFKSYSFARVGTATNAWVIGVSEKKSFAFKLPNGTKETIGCGADAVSIETEHAKDKAPLLLRCTFDGKCSEPQNKPYDVWPEKHDRTITTIATEPGVVGVMRARAGVRWGTYLATSMNGGKSFDLYRTIGEGEADRGFFEIGAVVGFPERIVILLSADVTGTRRRGWYVIASDDGGQSWREP